MKKTVILSAAVVSLGAVALGATAASAAPITYGTNAIATFEADTTTNPPVNPLDPSKPVTPIDDTKKPEDLPGGTTGPLSIDFASSFDFGTLKIKTTDDNYSAKLQKFAGVDGGADYEGPNYVQVTDKRGTLDGWSLSVKQNGQLKTVTTEEDEGGEELTGATISFAKAGLVSTMVNPADPEDPNISVIPTTIKTSLTLDPEDEAATPVVTAEADQGMGTWVYHFGANAVEGKDAVNLFVPGRTVKQAKTYSTTLTWSLEATPSNL